ncbi:zinc-binding alcohol dehydrogenase [Spongiimicrobium salis]|uniref:zinc-binding alcohol dehydrogenase n=1 Tax=Spongiimicrobium salis TaxID=1667022 RepID=UPI00374D9DB5
MKVKEIPTSLFHTLQLLSLSTKKLNRRTHEIPVVVSLASIPSRLHIVHIVIRSLLSQKSRPEKIMLWLHEDLKDRIPKKLSKLEGDCFKIYYSKLSCSHRKLVHPLEVYPEKVIVTCDDDMIYRKNWLRLLYEKYQEDSAVIWANQTRAISYTAEGELLPYKKWPLSPVKGVNPMAILPIGAGGTLYPPESLDKEVLNTNLFLKLTPKADDLWFKAMALKKGTISKNTGIAVKPPIPIIDSQKESLKSSNIGHDKNRTQWQAVSTHFNLVHLIK